MVNLQSPALLHFQRLASRGMRCGSSTYERAAFVIVEAMASGLRGFDGQAVQGMAEFAALAVEDSEAVRRWVASLASGAAASGGFRAPRRASP